METKGLESPAEKDREGNHPAVQGMAPTASPAEGESVALHSDQGANRSPLERLQQIVRTLRGPQGCAWDQKQNYLSMRSDLIEECYEVVEAVSKGDLENLKEELGDLLFLVFFYGQMAEEDGYFNIAEVAKEVSDKLERRHPHVFAGQQVSGVDEILDNWETIKAAERQAKGEQAHRQFLSYPALLQALHLQKQAIRQESKGAKNSKNSKNSKDSKDSRQDAGGGGQFPSVSPESMVERVAAELEQLRVQLATPAAAQERLQRQLGQLLFEIAALARTVKVDPELSLRSVNSQFAKRFAPPQ